MLGIIGAMDIEIEKINACLKNKKEEIISGVTYTQGTLGKCEVVTAICGVGKVFAAICTQTMILRYRPDAIINTGIAGTLSDKVGVLGSVVATALVQHDMDTSPLGDPKGLISGINVIEFPTDETLAQKICENIDTPYIRGIIASGDCFVADIEKKGNIRDTFNAVACEMEGAAVAHVCYMSRVPVCVVRTISDGADGGGELSYEEFRVKAADLSSEIMIKTIESM
ncbi:MAG: 5'-methylthioadenosine/adenosylhomocysteine nucleosidase [Clostridia bacterium]|nr:5'-methylthioadenosine/adenosylhomocysteine nucleosidase [Clostridia bacterium]